jgi:hypothetical protein
MKPEIIDLRDFFKAVLIFSFVHLRPVWTRNRILKDYVRLNYFFDPLIY